MAFLSKLFGRKDSDETQKTGGMEDFMTLIRVYFQAVMASELGINNLAALPDLRVFKTTLHVATVNNKLGVGERSRCKKMLKDIYEMDDTFFKEIDQSIKKHCRKLQDVQPYLLQFQAYTNDLLMLVTNLMKYKLRIPSMFKKTLYTATEQTVNDIFTKNDFKDASVMKTVVAIREYARRLGFTPQWTTDFVYKVVMLAKKEPRQKNDKD
ncbi:MAG: hypothetical protein IJP46_08935 [Prevotella sp.]|jgi:hypothetical protein|nr:hypothetical protein [Prevotella sp.]